MIHNSKSCFIILISLTLLTLATGCGKPDLSELECDITCYAAIYSKGIYKSENGGISWYPLDIDQEDIYLYFKKLFLSPDKRTLYVTTTGAGLFIIDEEKGSLDSVSQFKDDIIRTVAFKNASPGQIGGAEILVGMESRGVFKTRDADGDWEPFNEGLTYRDVNVFLAHGRDFFAGTSKDLFRWDEAEKEWKAISEGIKNKNIISMGIDPAGDTLYAGVGSYDGSKGRFESVPSLYKSTDKGQQWEASDKGILEGTLIYTIAVNPRQPERIYLGTSKGIFRSTNSGKKWSKMKEGIPEGSRIFDIKIIPGDDEMDLIYATGFGRVFMAKDDKKPLWVDRSYGLDKTNITSIVLMTGNGY